MSLRGRFMFDRFRRAIDRYIRLPVPPYGSTNYWEHSYKSLGPSDVIEWGRIDFSKLKEYRYTPVPLSSEHLLALGWSQSTKSTNVPTESEEPVVRTTSFGETMQIYPQASVDEPILIVGCGNSKLGEDMVEAKWRGPIIQLDVASRVIDAMTIRCAPYLPNGDMQLVQDDATLLSAVPDSKIKATIDKGLLDALFCADENDQIADCMRAAHRVLEPGGYLVTFSFSHPDFFLSRLLATNSPRRTVPWGAVEIRLLDSIYLYRFRKAPEQEMPRRASKKSSTHRAKR